MKKILFSLAMLAGFSAVNAQIYTEDFESGLGEWTVSSVSGTAVWKSASEAFPNLSTSPWGGPGPLDLGSNVALIDDDADSTGGGDVSTLTSPVIDLSGASNVTLVFDYFNLQYELPTMLSAEVYDGSAWQEVFFTMENIGDPDNPFIFVTNDPIDVSEFANANFQIRFMYDDAGDWSFGAAVDNIIVDGTMAVSDLNANVSSVYPNPVVDSFNVNLSSKFNANNVTVTVTDLAGRTVKTFGSASSSYNVADLAAGVYVVKITDGKNTETKKIVKK